MEAIADDFEASYAFDERDDAPAKHDLTWLFGLILLALVLIELRSWWRRAVDLAHDAPAGTGRRPTP